MRWYADLPAARARQVAADVWWAVCVLAAVLLGRVVSTAISALADPARGFAAGAGDLARDLRGAGRSAGDVPVVGDDLAAPLSSAADGAGALAGAGQQQVRAVEELATVLGVATAAVPIALVTAARFLPRWRWHRRAVEARRLTGLPGGEELLALRALQDRSPGELLRVHPEPAAAWRRGDTGVVRALADLQLRAVGLRREPSGGGRR